MCVVCGVLRCVVCIVCGVWCALCVLTLFFRCYRSQSGSFSRLALDSLFLQAPRRGRSGCGMPGFYDFAPWLGTWRRNQKHVNWFNYLAFWGMDEVCSTAAIATVSNSEHKL